VLCSDTKHDKRTKLLDVANELMDLWIEDTRDAESRILVIANDAQDAQLLEDWIAETGDQGQATESDAGLLAALKRWGDKCVNPEYDRVRSQLNESKN